MIYYLDHVTKEGKVCQKQILAFNFFERGVNKVISEEESEDDEVDSLLNSRSNTKAFVVKVGSDMTRTPSDQKNRLKNTNNLSNSDSGSDSQDYNKSKT